MCYRLMRLWATLAPSSALCCVFCCFSRNDAFLFFRPMFFTAYRWCLAGFTVFSYPAASNCMESSGIHLPTPSWTNRASSWLFLNFFHSFPLHILCFALSLFKKLRCGHTMNYVYLKCTVWLVLTWIYTWHHYHDQDSECINRSHKFLCAPL